MESIASHLIQSVEALEKGSFQKALRYADRAIEMNKKNFWGWYLGAISLAFLKDQTSFRFYLERAGDILPGSAYFKYLKVYSYILEDNEADAVIELTSLLDAQNGWFAHSLLEKIRSGEKLKEQASKGDIGQFVLIPNLKQELKAMDAKDARPHRMFSKSKKFRRKKYEGRSGVPYRTLMAVFASSCLIAGLIFLFFHTNFFETKMSHSHEGKIKIPAKVNILKDLAPRSFLYRYEHPHEMISDFKRAKNLLRDKKVNQARYLLQRILYSNADFATKEKTKIFLGFIPKLLVEEFDDPINPSQLLKHPKYYEGSQVLWEGVTRSTQTSEGGRQFEVTIYEKEKSFSVSAFIRSKENPDQWESYQNYKKTLDSKAQPQEKQIVIFGRFKGLIGKQKHIYLELDRLWL